MDLKQYQRANHHSKYGISSLGTIMETTPLLPCRPAILSPG